MIDHCDSAERREILAAIADLRGPIERHALALARVRRVPSFPDWRSARLLRALLNRHKLLTESLAALDAENRMVDDARDAAVYDLTRRKAAALNEEREQSLSNAKADRDVLKLILDQMYLVVDYLYPIKAASHEIRARVHETTSEREMWSLWYRWAESFIADPREAHRQAQHLRAKAALAFLDSKGTSGPARREIGELSADAAASAERIIEIANQFGFNSGPKPPI